MERRHAAMAEIRFMSLAGVISTMSHADRAALAELTPDTDVAIHGHGAPVRDQMDLFDQAWARRGLVSDSQGDAL
jgi:hypothetical protein